MGVALLLGSVLVTAAIFAGCGSESEGGSEPPELSIESAWSRPAAAGGTGVVYMTIHNSGGIADALTGVEADVAAAVEVHRSFTEGGVARMEHAPEIEIPPGESLTLEPGGYHIMLINLQRELTAGEHFDVTATFETSEPVSVSVEVRPN